MSVAVAEAIAIVDPDAMNANERGAALAGLHHPALQEFLERVDNWKERSTDALAGMTWREWSALPLPERRASCGGDARLYSAMNQTASEEIASPGWLQREHKESVAELTGPKRGTVEHWQGLCQAYGENMVGSLANYLARADATNAAESTRRNMITALELNPVPTYHDGAEGEPLWSTRPELAHIMTAAKSMKLSPWALLGQTLARTAATIPYWVQFRSFMGRRPINLLIAVSGSTGTGKTAAESATGEIFAWSRDVGPVHEAGSGEAIPAAYGYIAQKADSELGIVKGDLVWRHEDRLARFGFDEVGRLNAVQGRQGATMLEYMKSAESGAALGRILASGEGVQLPAREYRFVATVNLQPERAHLIMSADEAAGGLPGRMLWVNAEYAPFVGVPRSRERINPYPLARLDWTNVDAIDALPAMEDAFEAQQDAAHAGELDEMESHAALLRAKVACCLAVLAGRQALIDHDWTIAGEILDHSRTVRGEALKAIVSKDQEDDLLGGLNRKIRIIKKMKSHRSDGLTMAAARKKLTSGDRLLWDEVKDTYGETW